MASNINNNNNGSANGESEMVYLSIDYFAALSACPPEEIDQLLALPDLDEHNSGNVSTEQALQYLTAVMTLSPVFHESQTSSTASTAASLVEQSSAQITKESSKLFTNIRNAASILAPSAQHEISFSGILPKLKSITENPHAQVEFLQCCILASQYRYARESFDSLHGLGHGRVPCDGSDSKNAELYLRYHYLRGIIYYACDEITSAITEWNICISAPSHAMHHIILNAWKKMILAKCLMSQYDDEEEMATNNLKDFILSLPNGTSTAITRYFNGGTSDVKDVEEYKKLVGKFVQNELNSFLKISASSDNAVGSKLFSLLQEDGHMGMVKRLMPVMRWRKFRSISKIYTSIPGEKLARVLGLGHNRCMEFLMEAAIKQSSGGSCQRYRAPVDFTLDDEEGIVYFDAEEKEQDLEGRIEKCMSLAKRVKALDVALVSSSKYQINVRKKSREEKRETEPSRSVVEIS